MVVLRPGSAPGMEDYKSSRLLINVAENIFIKPAITRNPVGDSPGIPPEVKELWYFEQKHLRRNGAGWEF